MVVSEIWTWTDCLNLSRVHLCFIVAIVIVALNKQIPGGGLAGKKKVISGDIVSMDVTGTPQLASSTTYKMLIVGALNFSVV